MSAVRGDGQRLGTGNLVQEMTDGNMLRFNKKGREAGRTTHQSFRWQEEEQL